MKFVTDRKPDNSCLEKKAIESKTNYVLISNFSLVFNKIACRYK